MEKYKHLLPSIAGSSISESVIKKKYGLDATNVGDEYGFAPNIQENKEVLNCLRQQLLKLDTPERLSLGAEANGTEENPSATVSEHVDALLEAARYNDIDVVNSLAAIGVSLNSKDEEGRKALHMASANGNVNIVNYLISNNVVVNILILARAEVSSLNSHVRTPVDEAAIGGKMDVIDAINIAVAQMELTRTSV
ncbi:hypothetical protein LXL04_014505 [Taraxacum kok-saghyz]